ncbi:hypothetical protein PYK79_23165 [Streptomyces sp. ID05-04B]|nr:hypothetical protein [Streptomyces sp. ID05-04B]
MISPVGIRVWWHLERNEPWVTGLMPGMSRTVRQWVYDVLNAANQSRPLPPVPETEDQGIPHEVWPDLLKLDVATLEEGDPV